MGPIFDPVSPQAATISSIATVTFALCGVILVVVFVWVLAAVFRFRGRPGAPDPAPATGHTRTIEIAWTSAPILIVICLFFIAARGMSRSDPPDEGRPADLLVIGHQWWWEVRYPQLGIVAANEIHIPTGKRLLVRLDAADVIHDFWVPQLARKIDMVPGHPNAIWIEADRPGQYMGSCGEFCGQQHAWMRFTVIAESAEAFSRWAAGQKSTPAVPSDGAAARGLAIFRRDTCINCHNISGVGGGVQYGPDLTHFGSRQDLGAGRLSNTPAHLSLWLYNPQDLKPGCLMPNFQLPPADVADLTAYLESLR